MQERRFNWCYSPKVRGYDVRVGGKMAGDVSSATGSHPFLITYILKLILSVFVHKNAIVSGGQRHPSPLEWS